MTSREVSYAYQDIGRCDATQLQVFDSSLLQLDVSITQSILTLQHLRMEDMGGDYKEG